MAQPFQQSAARPGRIGRLLRSRRSEAFGAIEELLAQAPRVRDVGRDVVWGVCATHGVDLQRRFAAERKEFYRRYLEHCFEDKALSSDETADLQHLRAMLRLGEDHVREIHDAVARAVYGQVVDQVLADLHLDPQEEAFLRRLREVLQLPEADAARLYAEGEQRARERAMREATTQDRQFLEHRPPAGEFTGRSSTTLEDAVRDALSKAVRVIPQLHWFEVSKVAGYVDGGDVLGWHVTVRAGLSQEDLARSP